jgi:hypothetical protein
MTVSELIEKLKLLEQDAEVILSVNEFGWISDIDSTSLLAGVIDENYDFYDDSWDGPSFGMADEDLNEVRKNSKRCVTIEGSP